MADGGDCVSTDNKSADEGDEDVDARQGEYTKVSPVRYRAVATEEPVDEPVMAIEAECYSR